MSPASTIWRPPRSSRWATILVAGAVLTTAPAAMGSPLTPRLTAVSAPSRAHGASRAAIITTIRARSRPGGGRDIMTLSTQTPQLHEPQVLLVLGSRLHDGERWLRVLLPRRPDGSSGWISSRGVDLLGAAYWIAVDTDTRTVTVYDRGRLTRRFSAVVGKPSTPTPDGLTAVQEIERQPDPSGFLGTWALPLVLYSHALRSFDGGPGQIAIHGRGGASLLDPLGSALSHGCIRIDDSSVDWLAHRIPIGTPVQITS